MDVVIKEDLDSIKAEFAEPRRTLIEDGEEMVYVEAKEEAKEVIFVMDRFGYCKTMDLLHLREEPGDRGQRECPGTSGDDGR